MPVADRGRRINLLTAVFGFTSGSASTAESFSETAAPSNAPSSEDGAAMLLRLYEEERASRELEGEYTRVACLIAIYIRNPVFKTFLYKNPEINPGSLRNTSRDQCRMLQGNLLRLYFLREENVFVKSCTEINYKPVAYAFLADCYTR